MSGGGLQAGRPGSQGLLGADWAGPEQRTTRSIALTKVPRALTRRPSQPPPHPRLSLFTSHPPLDEFWRPAIFKISSLDSPIAARSALQLLRAQSHRQTATTVIRSVLHLLISPVSLRAAPLPSRRCSVSLLSFTTPLALERAFVCVTKRASCPPHTLVYLARRR